MRRTWRKERASIFMLEEADLSVREKRIPGGQRKEKKIIQKKEKTEKRVCFF